MHLTGGLNKVIERILRETSPEGIGMTPPVLDSRDQLLGQMVHSYSHLLKLPSMVIRVQLFRYRER